MMLYDTVGGNVESLAQDCHLTVDQSEELLRMVKQGWAEHRWPERRWQDDRRKDDTPTSTRSRGRRQS
jgi:hypothetical protein